MNKNIIKNQIICLGIMTLLFAIFLIPTESVQAASLNLVMPTFGLHCEEEEIIKNGNERFDLTDTDLLANRKAIKDSEYFVTGNQTVEFSIPFISTGSKIPSFNVTVNDQVVEGETWYGEDRWQIDMNNDDNADIKKFLQKVYSPKLDDTLIGTLYTLTSEGRPINISIKVEKGCHYIYDASTHYTSNKNAKIKCL